MLVPLQNHRCSRPTVSCLCTPKHLDQVEADNIAGVGVSGLCDVENWISELWWTLKLDFSHSLCTKELKRALFAEAGQEKEIDSNGDNDDDNGSCKDDRGGEPTKEIVEMAVSKPSWIVQGVPERPFYKEVARRLFRWNNHCFPPSSHNSSPQNSSIILANETGILDSVIVPAEALGFEEISPILQLQDFLPPRSRAHIREWLSSDAGGDGGIYRLLGVRNTVGSILPYQHRLVSLPNKRSLLNASGILLGPKSRQRGTGPRLTAAARARAKHAHRAIQEARFFGNARGPVAKQNQEAARIIRDLLDHCVWINCHVFGGLPTNLPSQHESQSGVRESVASSWVVEIRQEHGYGARWLVEATPDETSEGIRSVTFRGFLEPQMEGGHERKWRH